MPNLTANNQNYTTGIGIAYQVTLAGTAGSGNVVTQNVTGTVDGNTFTVQNMKGPEYHLILASTSDTCQLTAGIIDCNGTPSTVDASNGFTFTSWNATPIVTSMSNTGSPSGTELVSFSAATMSANWEPSTLEWQSEVVTVSSSGLVSANAVGHGTIEVRYPLSVSATGTYTNGVSLVNNPQFICARLQVVVQ